MKKINKLILLTLIITSLILTACEMENQDKDTSEAQSETMVMDENNTELSTITIRVDELETMGITLQEVPPIQVNDGDFDWSLILENTEATQEE